MTVVMSYVSITSKWLTPQLEHLIELVASLPPGNVQKSMTTSFISTLWDNLLHPPLSYLGNDVQYRSADGSNNVYTTFRSKIIVEYHVSKPWEGGYSIRKECRGCCS
jgi:hypothetical protein